MLPIPPNAFGKLWIRNIENLSGDSMSLPRKLY